MPSIPPTWLREQDPKPPLFDQPTPCAQAQADPSWWDLDTHVHTIHHRCQFCAWAISICGTCPVQDLCARIGAQLSNPTLIYGGKVWAHGKPTRVCRRCHNPLQGTSGVRRASGMCSDVCEWELD